MDEESERQVSVALRKAAGLLTPDEIREGRRGLQLTQKALAEKLDIAEATLSRWETGAQMQQRVLDKILRAYFGLPELRRFFAGEVSPTEAVGQIPVPISGSYSLANLPVFA